MKYEIKKLSFPETWKEAFKLYGDNFVPLFAISLVSNLPILFATIPRVGVSESGEPQFELLELMMWLALLVMLSTLSTLFMMEYIFKKYQGKHQGASEYLKSLVPMLGPIFGLTVFSTFIISLGMLAFVIPGIYAALTLSMAWGVLIVERQPVQIAVVRSVWLTHNKKMEIFSYSVVLGIISFMVERLLSFFFTLMEPTQMVMRIQQMIGLLTQALLAPISACLFILIYFNIRIEKEGFLLTQRGEKTDDSTPE